MERLLLRQAELSQHPIYQTFSSTQALRHFMRYHVFAVWDFMSLLKSLQRHITCVNVPWTPSRYPAEMVRLVNQIVLGEESDVDLVGNPISHFELYLKAMEEVGASTFEIRNFLETMNLNRIPLGARAFVAHNLDVAMDGDVVEVAASFFYGREKLIPEMFKTIVTTLKRDKIKAPTLLYYLERHIEVDAEEHGPLALKCLEFLTAGDEKLKSMSQSAGLLALEKRKTLWDEVLKSMPAQKSHSPALNIES